MILKNRRLSISKKLTLIYSGILLSILICFTLIIFFSIRNIIIKDSESELASNTDIIISYINNKQSIDTSYLNNINLSAGINFSIFDKENNIYYTNRAGKPPMDKPLMGKHINEGNRKFKGKGFENEKGTLYTNKEININGNIYNLQVTKDFEDIGAKTGALVEILIITSVLGTLVSFISGSFLSKKLLRPISDITNTTKNITSKSLDKRISTNGADDELKDLSDTINSMIERLQMDFEKQRRFVSDASHELRTPLAVIHGHVNMLNRWGKNDPEVLNNSLNTLKSETENMNRLIESLLYLAKGDNNRIIMKMEEFPLSNLFKEVVDETVLTHNQYNINYDCNENILVKADYNALKQVLRILVDNSIKYNSHSGEVLIKGEKCVEGIGISVKDNGVGISSEAISHIFDRFYRADESRTKSTGGTGLGLSIAKQIVDLHKGEIFAESELGKWTKITIIIPHNV